MSSVVFRRGMAVAVMLVMAPCVCAAAVMEEVESGRYTIRLQARSFTPEPGIGLEERSAMADDLDAGRPRHTFVQFHQAPTSEERQALEQSAGIRLLEYIGGETWFAVLSSRAALDFDAPDAAPLMARIRWVGAIEPTDKIDVKIQEEGFGDYARGPDGTVGVIVKFFRDVDASQAAEVLGRYGGQAEGPGLLNDWRLEGLTESQLTALAAEDGVQYIEEVPPPETTNNDCCRTSANVDPAQAAPYNLDGNNVQVGEWDGGQIGVHADLAGRRTIVESVGVAVSDHATHVAGTLAGDGSQSAGSGGAATQWRGVATDAELFSWTFLLNDLEPEEHQAGIQDADKLIDLSQNSWGLVLGLNDPLHGNYRSRTAKYDNIVHGVYGRRIPIVFSAGNNQGAIAGGFGTLTPPGATGKNVITVGAINCDDSSMTNFSSFGPTDDGRLKPDVVAPGGATGAAGIVSTIPQNNDEDVFINATGVFNPAGDGVDDFFFPYSNDDAGPGEPEPVGTAATPEGAWEGTSMAAPVVSGTVALMLQQYRETYFGADTVDDAPLPSTFKAILCHTATDLVANPGGGANLTGPDYVYGYGLIDAQGAVDVIDQKRFREGTIHSGADEDLYTIQVPAGAPELRVTLAWDDEPGTVGAAVALQNDLDLMLINPAGNQFHPPWELDPTTPGNAATRASYATEAIADTHRDNLNVVEQVLVTGPAAGDWTVRVKAAALPQPSQRYSLVAGAAIADQLAGRVDVVQVLDRSGSMGGQAASTAPDTKIQVLRSAADQFIQMMRPDVGNQLGLVQFNHDVVTFPAGVDPTLQPLTTVPDRVTHLSNAVAGISHGGATSIGDGLDQARAYFTASGSADNDSAVLLVTDGRENSPLMISAVQANLVADGIAVYPLGLGYGSGIDEGKLTALAAATGGSYRITSDPLVFRKFFLEILAGAVDWSVIVDPIGNLGSGGVAEVPLSITADQVGASFTVYWEGVDDALDLELVPPSGPVIDKSVASPRIRYEESERYAFFQLDSPLDGAWASVWAGPWKMRIRGTSQIPAGQTVRYSSSAFGEGGAVLEASFDRQASLTGDTLLATARLSRGGSPLPGAQIEVYCEVPKVGMGNLLRSGAKRFQARKASETAAAATGPDGDLLTEVDRRLDELVARAGGIGALRSGFAFDLFDDARHGDGGRDDGVYANSFSATRVQGSYTCTFIASNIPTAAGGTTTREWSTSFYNEVAIDPASSEIDTVLLGSSNDIHRYRVQVTPRDRFGNYLGPGRPVVATFVGPGPSSPVTLTDRFDGTYVGEISVPESAIGLGGRIEIEVDGRPFTAVEPPTMSRWSLSLHAGLAQPRGSLSNLYDEDQMLALDLEYRLKPRWSVVGLLGYNAFAAKLPGVPDTYLLNLSVNGKHLFGAGGVKPYVNFGGGLYRPSSGSTEPGANVGAGVEWDYAPLVRLSAGVDYHRVFVNGDIDFVTIHVGGLFSF